MCNKCNELKFDKGDKMVLVGYVSSYSFNGDFDYNMGIVRDGEITELKDKFFWVSMDNFVDKNEVFDSIVVNVEDDGNLKDVFMVATKVTNKCKTMIKGVKTDVVKMDAKITYYDKRFEEHIPLLVKDYNKAVSDKNNTLDINLVFEYAPNDKIHMTEEEFSDMLEKENKLPKEVIKNIFNELKGE